MKIVLAQLNPTVGDLEGNLEKLAAALKEANDENADLLVLPELFLCGYPPRDLLDKVKEVGADIIGLSSLMNISKLQ